MSSATSNSLFISSSPLIQKAIITSGAVASAQSSLECLTTRLSSLAEYLYLKRDIRTLAEVASLLCSLPHAGAQTAGLYYRALCLCRHDDIEAARHLSVVAEARHSPYYRARAIQTLGAIQKAAGNLGEAARLYQEAITFAVRSPRLNLLTIIKARMNLSALPSIEGDHAQALDQLQEIHPTVKLVERFAPVLVSMFANDLAYELCQVGRIEEARCYAGYAISSPFARAYPEWLETAREIEQQAKEKAAPNRNVRPALKLVRRASTKPPLRHVEKPCPVALPAATRPRTGPVVIIRPEQPRRRPILEQISLKVRIRAPSI